MADNDDDEGKFVSCFTCDVSPIKPYIGSQRRKDEAADLSHSARRPNQVVEDATK